MLLDSGKRLSSGKYHFVLMGETTVTGASMVEIVSKGGLFEHGKFDFHDNIEPGGESTVIASGTFLLEVPVHNLEVKVIVSPASNIRIDGYEIEYIPALENESHGAKY